MAEKLTVTGYRISRWIDTSNLDLPELPIKYGIEARVSGRGWINCALDGDALLFDNPADAEAKIAQFRARRPSPDPQES